MLKKYLEDDSKNPSSMRLMSFTSLWMSFLFAIAVVFELPGECKDEAAIEGAEMMFYVYFGGAFGGKAGQKIVEKVAEVRKIKAGSKPSTEQREDNEEKKS